MRQNNKLSSFAGLGNLLELRSFVVYRNPKLSSLEGINPHVQIEFGTARADLNGRSLTVGIRMSPLKVCRPGEEGILGVAPCSKCPAGKFRSVAGFERCSNCAVGHVSPEEGATECYKCTSPLIAIRASEKCYKEPPQESRLVTGVCASIITVLACLSIVIIWKVQRQRQDLSDLKRGLQRCLTPLR